MGTETRCEGRSLMKDIGKSVMKLSPLGPGPGTKSLGTGLKNIVIIARNAGIKASLDIRRAVPLFFSEIGN